jgi:hypothetical protein
MKLIIALYCQCFIKPKIEATTANHPPIIKRVKKIIAAMFLTDQILYLLKAI